ncbi:MAG: CPBP family intramembrane metalloprotease [Clostridia bacterium]|nr:CPBP family intramembrane metalloprotease [Clostridia bacterium]
MKTIAKKFPILSSAIISVVFLALTRLVGNLWIFGNSVVALFAYEAVHILIPFLFVLTFSDLEVYKKGSMLKTFGAGGYMLLSQLFLFLVMLAEAFFSTETVWRTPVGIAFGAVTLFGIGFREESIFRGIVVNNIAKKYISDKKGVYITTIASGVMFGLVHLVNLWLDIDPFSVVIQSIVAMGAGFYFAAVYLRGGSLWALIIMHTLADAASLFGASFTMNNGTAADAIGEITLLNLTPFFVLSLLTLFLLRKEKCDGIVARFKSPE